MVKNEADSGDSRSYKTQITGDTIDVVAIQCLSKLGISANILKPTNGSLVNHGTPKEKQKFR